MIQPPAKVTERSVRMREFDQNRVDALLPSQMAEKAELVGVDKTRLDTLSLMALAVLAGAFVAFGSLFSVKDCVG